jgi:lysophospholipid acyltransferase (LPLAT)-like uncharacterized protein
MSPVKRLLGSGAARRALVWLAARYLALIRATTRWSVECPAATRTLIDQGRPFIICFWHGRLALTPAAQPEGRRVHGLMSGHRDGLLYARAIAGLGLDSVEGSSRRGGGEALRRLCRLLARNEIVAITPDGPRGPRMRVKPGAVKAAQLSGAPLVPLAAAARRQRRLGTWDRFCLALPFSRGVILWGEPIPVPRRAEPEALEGRRRVLEQRLNGLTAEADRRCGQDAVEPAPAADSVRHAGA